MINLKFRVWHKEFKKFLDKSEWLLDLDGKLVYVDMALDAKRGDYVKLAAVNQDLYVIQAFTGALDINGHEIYEGDIIRVFGERYSSKKDVNDIGDVFYSEEMATYGCCDKKLFTWEKYIILGNIFEDSKLLDK